MRNKYLISHIPTIALQTVDSNIRKGVNRVIQTEYVESTPDVTYPYVSLQEILRNGSVVRPELFHKPAYQSIRYEWGKTTCQNVSAEVPNTTRLILNRKFITVNKMSFSFHALPVEIPFRGARLKPSGAIPFLEPG